LVGSGKEASRWPEGPFAAPLAEGDLTKEFQYAKKVFVIFIIVAAKW
jgi:hypothetical protein